MIATDFLLQLICEIALQAGEELMEVYDDKRLFTSSRLKKEKSPFTIAEFKAEDLIVKRLQELEKTIPIIAEGYNKTSYYYRKSWNRFWLIDALNGTREFLKQTNEFTLNIALIENGIPVLGVVYAPALNLLYAANEIEGAFKIHKNKRTKIKSNKDTKFLIAVTSLFEPLNEEEEKKEWSRFPIKKIITAGSTLRFCKIAEGAADIYYRHASTMEWETAAGEAIVRISGGMIQHLRTENFHYNKQMLKNKSFICTGDPSLLAVKVEERITY